MTRSLPPLPYDTRANEQGRGPGSLAQSVYEATVALRETP